jgi:membrane-associated phospholipid phosphatase
LAEIISALFNAPIVAIYVFTLILLILSPPDIYSLLFVSLIFGGILPMLIIFLMLRAGIIHDIYASDRQTRLKPFLGAILSYSLGVAVLLLMNAPRDITALMACYSFNTLVMMLISLKWKISIHASGISGPFTFLVFVLGPVFLPLYLLILPVGWARIELNAHSLSQVLAGFLLTILLTWLQLTFFLA